MGKFSFAHLVGLGSKTTGAEDTSDKEKDESEKDKEEDTEDETEAEGGDDAEKDAAVQQRITAAVTAERARCASIFALPAAANNVAQAAELAFNTDLTVEQAAKVLGTAPKAANDRLARAMANRSPNLGADTSVGQPDEKAAAAGWDRAAEMANQTFGHKKK